MQPNPDRPATTPIRLAVRRSRPAPTPTRGRRGAATALALALVLGGSLQAADGVAGALPGADSASRGDGHGRQVGPGAAHAPVATAPAPVAPGGRMASAATPGTGRDPSGRPAATDARPLAFSGAEGFGRFARGGRGGAVHTVTHLGDDGPGSLRAAVESDGPRTVVFAVAGTIALTRPLLIERGLLTIAGQSAPGQGITLRDQPLLVAADDVVIRYLRSRLGDAGGAEADAIWIQAGRDIILDHVSASWSTDEVLSVANLQSRPDRVLDRVTVQWSFITESLDASLHGKGAHGFGSLVRGSRGARYSLHHNLWAHHRARLPRPGNYAMPEDDPVGLLLDLRNNVIHNWGVGAGTDAGAAPILAAGYNIDPVAISRYNVVGNAYLRGADSRAALAFFDGAGGSQAFFAGNSMDGLVPTDPWSLVGGSDRAGYRLPAPLPVAPVATDSAAVALARVLAAAGASRRRDAVDHRIVAQLCAGTGAIIDSQEDVGGWPAIPAARAQPDRDGDGIPDAWERRHGLDPDDPADGARTSRDGYTWLERWLAARATTLDARGCPGYEEPAPPRSDYPD
jgi:hypothetical protein